LVYTPQTIDVRRARWHWLYAQWERILAPFTDAIISVNESDRQRLIRWGISPQRVVTIPNGIELDRFGPPESPKSARQRLASEPPAGRLHPLAPDRPLVLQVARLSAQKDPLTFVEGAALIAERHPVAQFAMAGTGPLHETVASRIHALGLQDRVHLLGWHDCADRLMAAADVITLTSRWEGAPYSLLEAMAQSRPVVATAVNGCPEIVSDQESGYLAPPGDTVAWAARVSELLGNPERAAAMGKKGRAIAEQRFSIQVTTAHTEQLYLDLIDRKRWR
jgi:glycosyltransferase involved in cell wall biosynthesis